MEQNLLFSKLRPSIEGPSFLETIRDSASGEYPHRATVMEQIFERTIHDFRGRVFVQAKETSQQAVPAVPTVTLPAVTLPTTPQPLPLVTKSEPSPAQPVLQPQQGPIRPLYFFSNPTTRSTTQPSKSERGTPWTFNLPQTPSKPQQPIKYPDPFVPLDRSQRK